MHFFIQWLDVSLTNKKSNSRQLGIAMYRGKGISPWKQVFFIRSTLSVFVIPPIISSNFLMRNA